MLRGAVRLGSVTVESQRGVSLRVWRGDDLTAGMPDARLWESPVVTPGHRATELVPSWNAVTPPGTRIQVEARATLDDGSDTGWLVLARWSSDNGGEGATQESQDPQGPDAPRAPRTSVSGQESESWAVETDTLVARDGRLITEWQVRVHLHGTGPEGYPPRLTLVAGVASDESPDTADSPEGGIPTSVPTGIPARTLAVPTLSQMRHRGHYPQWDGGGSSWCSPTSLAMVLRYWGTGPAPADTAWVQAHDDPQDTVVDAVAREVFDPAYGGAGNWAFNTAYAARFGLEAYVTRLRSLREAEQFIAAGIPVIASVSFEEDALPGAGYDTQGHLLVIVGFTGDGDVVVNDPASHLLPDNDQVRTTYSRKPFERAWLRPTGTVYVLHPPDVPLPAPPAQANW